MKLTAELVDKTLVSCYSQDRGKLPRIETPVLMELLATLQPLSDAEELENLTYRLKARYPERQLSPRDYSQLAFVDDCISTILERAELDYRVESMVRAMTPAIARLVLEEGLFRITKAHPLLAIIDQLCKHCIGWSHDLGILGERFLDDVSFVIKSLVSRQGEYDKRLKELKRILTDDHRRLMALEKNLGLTGMNQLKEERARRIAVTTLNQEMAGRDFSLFIVLMLQGPWFEFLQNVVIYYDDTSKRWEQAVKLTAAMVWALQPSNYEKSQARSEQLMSSLPEQLAKLMQSMVFDTTQLEQSFGDLEAEFEAIARGEPSDTSDFDLLKIESGEQPPRVEVSQKYMKAVRKLRAGQWLMYDDDEERIARIKIILKLGQGREDHLQQSQPAKSPVDVVRGVGDPHGQRDRETHQPHLIDPNDDQADADQGHR